MKAPCPSCKAEIRSEATDCPHCGCILRRSEAADPLIGVTVGNLVLVSKLGAGGMGGVYRAEHRSLKTPYAVKVLHPQFSNNPVIAERFRREALACTKLRHENVVFVTDFGTQEGVGIYLIMEFLEGASLKQVFRQSGRLTMGRLGRIGTQICDAMAAAHRLSIVHRDLKPDNILLLQEEGRPDFVKVLDFGIAHIQGAGEEHLTQAGTTMGTPTYIAPEQVIGKPNAIGPHTDIYTLGVIFFEMLAGSPPFPRGETEFEVLQHHVSTPAPLVSTRYPLLAGTGFEALIASMLEKKPQRRPRSMQEVRQRLVEAVREMQERGEPEAFYEEVPQGRPAREEGGGAPVPQTSPSLHVTTLVRKIKAEAPDSAAAGLLQALPNADRLGGESIALALWGILQQEVVDAPPGSERFAHAAQQLGLLLDAILTSHGNPTPTEFQERMFRALVTLLSQAPTDRHKKLTDVLRPLAKHPLFPQAALAPPGKGGGWQAFKAAMNREIKIPWRSDTAPGKEKEPAPPAKRTPAPAAARAPQKAPQAREQETLPAAYLEHADRGKALYRSEKFEEAIREFEAAFLIKPTPALLFNIGGAYRMLGKPRQALEYFERYRNLDPNLPFQVKAKLLDFITDALKQIEELDRRERQSAAPPAAAPQAAPAGTVVLMTPQGAVPVLAPPGAVAPQVVVMTPQGAAPVLQPLGMPGVPGVPQQATQGAGAPAPAATPQSGASRGASSAESYPFHYERASSLYKAARYEEAIGHFEAAYQARPHAALLASIAVAHRKLENHREALDYFDRYLRAEPNLARDVQVKIQAAMAEARKKIQEWEDKAKAPPTPPAAVEQILDDLSGDREHPRREGDQAGASEPGKAPETERREPQEPTRGKEEGAREADQDPSGARQVFGQAAPPSPPKPTWPVDWDPDAPLMLERDACPQPEKPPEERPPEPQPRERPRPPVQRKPPKEETTLSGTILSFSRELFGKKKPAK